MICGFHNGKKEEEKVGIEKTIKSFHIIKVDVISFLINLFIYIFFYKLSKED